MRMSRLVLLMLSSLVCMPGAQAQVYPTRPVKLILPLAPGGGTDVVTRLTAERLSAALGQPFVVENRPGGNMAIGAAAVAAAPADGYTLLVTLDSALTLNPFIMEKLSYDPVKDFAPVGLLTRYALVMVAGPKTQASTLADLIRFGKTNPDKLDFGAGSPIAQLSGALFNRTVGTSAVIVPYRGSAPAIQSLLAGDIAVAFSDFGTAAPHVEAGKLKALATTGSAREILFPNVPTVRESGYPDYEVTGWTALFAPAGTPPVILERLNREIAKLAADKTFVERVRKASNSDFVTADGSEVAKRITADMSKWGTLIKSAGLKLGH